MPNNRYTISDTEIVRPAEPLSQGLPILGFAGSYEVMEGWQAIITENGEFRTILGPGRHSLRDFSFWSNVKAIAVDTRRRTLAISSKGDFTISKPVPVQVDLEMSVEYQIVAPQRVALEIERPLTGLFDRALTVAKDVIARLTVDETRTQAIAIGEAILHSLHRLHLNQVLGLDVSSVLITRIAPQATEGDVLAGVDLTDYTAVRDWQRDSAMLQNTRVTWQWLLMHRPEVAQQLIAQHGDMAKLMFEKTGDPASAYLNAPVGSSPLSMGGGIPNLVPPGLFAGSQQPPLGSTSQAPQIASPQYLQERLREEEKQLESISGLKVRTKPGKMAGSYDLHLQFKSSAGKTVDIYMVCPANYPHEPPISIEVDLDKQPIAFRSQVAGSWHSTRYLIEIVREVQRHLP